MLEGQRKNPAGVDAPQLVIRGLHRSKSTAIIEEAAAMADLGRVALLGCGSCAEIPLGALSQRFERLDLVDLDGDALRIAALGALPFDSGLQKCAFHVCDVTGLKDRLERSAEEIVAEEPTAAPCLGRLAEVLASSAPVFWRPGDDARYDLIVCSGVLTQLQARIRESVQDIFLGRHPDGRSLLRSHEQWTRSVWRFARALEHAFVDHLEQLAKPGGVVYLADTVHVWWLTQADAMTLISPGAWVATETSRLEDYLDERFEVRLRDHWNRFRQAREGDFWGRLYGIQALVCHTRSAGQERDGRRVDLDEEKTMSNGGRRPLPLRPRSGAAATRTTSGPNLSRPGSDINDPLNTRGIVQQFVREQIAREAAPVREWLDANVDSLRGLALPALLARVRRDVPEARELPEIQIEAIVREWANLRGVSIPQVSLIPLPGVSEIPPPSGPSLADSDLARAVRSLLSIPTSVEVKRPHGRTEIGISGATVELISGASRVGGSISWGGTMGVFTEVGGVRFEGSLSAERWTMSVSFPPGAPTPDLNRLGEIFREGERSFRAIARETGSLGSLREVSEASDAISPHLEPVKRAIDAARGIAESGGRRVSFSLGAGGPGPSSEASDEGFTVSATLTIRF